MKTLIHGAHVVNEGKVEVLDILLENDLISRVEKPGILQPSEHSNSIDAAGLHLFPGLIDDQVHFREPGLTDKAEISTESRGRGRGRGDLIYGNAQHSSKHPGSGFIAR